MDINFHLPQTTENFCWTGFPLYFVYIRAQEDYNYGFINQEIYRFIY